MHELSLVAAIIDHALEVLAREGAARVLTVTLGVGVLSCADPSALAFCFPLATRGTALAGARLELHPDPLVLHCTDCGFSTSTNECELVCAACHSCAVEVRGGRDLVIASLEVA
jgi:hydrogenase nickel incorporation protein HypA/HybF